MTRYSQSNEIERLKAEAHVADQVVEDLSRALEDSERVCDRYREALVHIEQVVAIMSSSETIRYRVQQIIKDAMWTRMKEAS